MQLGRMVVNALTLTTLAFAADPFVGKWRLNAEKGQSENVGKPKSATTSIERPRGVYSHAIRHGQQNAYQDLTCFERQ